VTPGLKPFRRALLLAGALFFLLTGPASAAAPCWKRLLNDWYDGHIDKVYPIACYHQAIAHLPTDVQVYSSARDDIQRALQRAIAGSKATPTKTTTPRTTTARTTTARTTTASRPHVTTTTETKTTAGGHTTTQKKVVTTKKPTTTASTPTTTTTATTTTTPGRKKKKGIVGAIDKLNPGSANSFPLPLLILGALALLLILAGLGGMAWRRFQGPPGTP
jgi:cobalamin biosynthesis Mg chelatase CobN